MSNIPSYPRTEDEWWLIFDHHRDNLRSLVAKFYPIGAKSSPETKISAPGAERACEIVREQIAKESNDDPVAEFDRLTTERNGKNLVRLLNNTWFGMPECMEVRSEPGFHGLCNLCSESYCVTGDEGEWED